jgi:hypothetical protein
MLSENEKLAVFLTEGLKTLNLHSAVKTERDSDSELWIHLLDLGVSVFVDDEGGTRKGIGREIKVPSYQVYTVEHYPATREQPEDMGETMRRECSRVDDAVAEVFAIVAKDRIYGMIEAVGPELDLGFTPGVRADGIPTPDPGGSSV